MVNMQLVTSDSKLRVRIEAETLGPLIVAWIRPALDAMFKLSRWCGIAGGWRVATDRILLFVFGRVANIIHSREIVEYWKEFKYSIKD